MNNPGSDLLSHAVTRSTAIGVESLTSVFGMGTGVTLSYDHREIECLGFSAFARGASYGGQARVMRPRPPAPSARGRPRLCQRACLAVAREAASGMVSCKR